MTHIGPDYSKLGGAQMADCDLIRNTQDSLRNKDMSWNGDAGLFVKWTDGFNQKHTVRLHGKSDEITLIFPVSGKQVNWYNGFNEQGDCTRFVAQCNWVKVKFFHVDSDWINNHGIRIHLKGYSNISSRSVDWDRVEKELKAGKDITEISAAIPPPPTVATDRLEVDDFRVVQTSLWTVRSNWFQIGVELHLQVTDLDAIRVDCHDQSEPCFRVMIRQWLERAEPKPTWQALIAALREDTVGQKALADKIAAEHPN